MRRGVGEPARAAGQAAEIGRRGRGRRWGRAGRYPGPRRGGWCRSCAAGARFCRAGSSEEAPGESSAGAPAAGPPGDSGERPPEEASGPPAHALLLGGYERSRAPKVSGPGRDGKSSATLLRPGSGCARLSRAQRVFAG